MIRSGSDDSQDSALKSNKEQGTSSQKSNDNDAQAAAAAILQLQPQVREMEISWGTLANIWFNMFQMPSHK